MIIVRTIGTWLVLLRLCTDPSSSIILTSKAVETTCLRRDLSKPPQRGQGREPRPLWLLFGTPSVLRPELAFRRAEHSLLWWMSSFIFDIHFCTVYHLTCLCSNFCRLSTFVGCCFSGLIRRIIYKCLKVCPFDYTNVAVIGKVFNAHMVHIKFNPIENGEYI